MAHDLAIDAAASSLLGALFFLGYFFLGAKSVAHHCPLTHRRKIFRRLVRADFLAPLMAGMHADRYSRAAGGAPGMLPVVAQDPMASSALPTADSYQWFTETAASRAPTWRNEVTLRTIEYGLGYEPAAYIGLISPTPLMMIVGLNDHLTVSDLAIAAYERAYEPKRLVLMRGGHFDAHVEGFDQSAGPACEWFRARSC